MKGVNTGRESPEKTVIRMIPGIEIAEVVREKKVLKGIIKTETVEVVREMKVWRGKIETEEVMQGMRAVTGVTVMIRITEKFQALGVSIESQAPPLT